MWGGLTSEAIGMDPGPAAPKLLLAREVETRHEVGGDDLVRIGLAVARVDRKSPVVARKGLNRPSQIDQPVAQVLERGGLVWLDGERGMVAGEAFAEAPEVTENEAAVGQGRRVEGSERERLVVASQRLLRPTEMPEDGAAAVQCLDMGG